MYHLPDMKIPIANALFDSKFNYAKYFKYKGKPQNLNKKLDFFKPDIQKFSTLQLIPKMNNSKSGPIIVNAANEIFVDEFLKKNIHFDDIFTYLNLVLKDRSYIKTSKMPSNSVKNIYKIDKLSRAIAFKIIKNNK